MKKNIFSRIDIRGICSCPSVFAYVRPCSSVLLSVLLLCLVFISFRSSAMVIKLGTLAPKGSQWYNALMEINQNWQKISNGKIKFRIYAGGIAGDGPDMVRKMRIGQLHAAALTTYGMSYIYPDISALTFPNFIKTDDELKHIIKKVGPFYEKEIYKKGFKILNWSNAGWVYFFSKTPVVTPDDMKKQKLAFWGSETRYIELLKKSGFQPVSLSVTDLLPSLQTGLVTAFATTPQAALGFQWYPLAPNMCGLRWQPLPSMIIITKKKWLQIPEKLRPKLVKSIKKFSPKLWETNMQIQKQAISAMKKHGLKVYTVLPKAKLRWQKLISQNAYKIFVGHRFSRNIFEKIQAALDEHKKKNDTLSHPLIQDTDTRTNTD